jgi:hypothetical protein
MALATTAATAIRYIVESAFGQVPGTGNAQNLRFTGESLAFNITKSESNEIRSDRQITDLVPTNADANGDINYELSYREYDDLIEAALMGAWNPYGTTTKGVGQGVGTNQAIAGISAGTTLTPTAATTGTNLFTILKKGQWFKLTTVGGTGANNNKFFKVSGTVAPTAATLTLDASTPLLADASVTGFTISATHLENASTERSFTVERAHTDILQFFTFRGMEVSKMSLKLATGAMTTGSFSFMGKDVLPPTGTSNVPNPGTITASTAYDVHNGVASVGGIYEGGALLSGTFIKSCDFTVDNSMRARDGLGNLGNVGIGNGTCKVTGNIEVYLSDGTLYNKFLNNTPSSISVISRDAASNGYVFTFPNIKYGDAKVNAGGRDQDVMLQIPFTALLDTVTGKTILIDRCGV